MNDKNTQHGTRTAAAGQARALPHRDQQADIQLAHLVMEDESEEGGAYRLFARALARQLRRRRGSVQAIGEEDVIAMLRSAARELLAERKEE